MGLFKRIRKKVSSPVKALTKGIKAVVKNPVLSKVALSAVPGGAAIQTGVQIAQSVQQQRKQLFPGAAKTAAAAQAAAPGVVSAVRQNRSFLALLFRRP